MCRKQKAYLPLNCAVYADLEKTFFDGLIKSKPDVLFIDLIDERYPICGMSNSWFSYNPVIQAIESLSALEACTRMEKSSTDALHAWNAAVDKWAATIRLVLPGLRIVLVDARFAIVSRSSSGNEIAEDGAMLNWCQESNRMLEKMMGKLISALPSAHVIAPPKEVRVSDGDHRWGKQPFHYVPEWYDYVAKSALKEVDDSELRE